MYSFVVCKVPLTENSLFFTKAFVSYADYNSLMEAIKKDYMRSHLCNGPYITIENQVFELAPDMNLYDGSIAINKYHRAKLNKAIGDTVGIGFLDSTGVFC